MGLYAHDIDTDVDTRKPKGGTMPRTLRAPKLETRTARLKLPIAKRPYWTQIGTGISLGYRRNAGPGTWSVRVAHAGGHWSEVIATADDYTDANGATVMDYWQAADKVRTIGQSARYGGHSGKLGTVLEALDAYEATLRTRGADVGNANRVRMYLPAALAAKAVATLTLVDFKAWRAALTKAGLMRRPPIGPMPAFVPLSISRPPKMSASPTPVFGSEHWRTRAAPAGRAMSSSTKRRSAPSSPPPTSRAPNSVS